MKGAAERSALGEAAGPCGIADGAFGSNMNGIGCEVREHAPHFFFGRIASGSSRYVGQPIVAN